MTNLIGTIILVAVALIVVGALLPTIADFTNGLAGTGNVTGTSASMLLIVLPIFLIGIIVAVLGAMKVVKLAG